MELTHWPLGDLDAILKLQFSILFYWLVSSVLLMIMHPYGCHMTSTDDKSTLVQVMAWCRQATSHYLSQCWPSSMSPHGVTRPQWVDVIWIHRNKSEWYLNQNTAFSVKKTHLKILSAKWQPFWVNLNVLRVAPPARTRLWLQSSWCYCYAGRSQTTRLAQGHTRSSHQSWRYHRPTEHQTIRNQGSGVLITNMIRLIQSILGLIKSLALNSAARALHLITDGTLTIQGLQWTIPGKLGQYIDGLVQEQRKSIANALELCLSCTNPSIS